MCPHSPKFISYVTCQAVYKTDFWWSIPCISMIHTPTISMVTRSRVTSYRISACVYVLVVEKCLFWIKNNFVSNRWFEVHAAHVLRLWINIGYRIFADVMLRYITVRLLDFDKLGLVIQRMLLPNSSLRIFVGKPLNLCRILSRTFASRDVTMGRERHQIVVVVVKFVVRLYVALKRSLNSVISID